MGRLITFYLATLLTLPCVLLAQSYNFINYNIDDGLAHEKITDICEDSYGNLWIGTLGGGLSQFNGIEFTNYTEKDGLCNNIVRAVAKDSFGNIWASTANGMSRYDGSQFMNFLVDSLNAISSVNVLSADNRGNIWFSHPEGGLGKVNSDLKVSKVELEGSVPNDKIIDIQAHKSGAIYFVTAIRGLFRYTDHELTLILSNRDFKGFLLDIQFVNDTLMHLGSNKGLVKLTLTNSKSYEIKWGGSFITSSITKGDKELWMISGGRALRDKSGQLDIMNSSSGFTEFQASKIYADRELNLWFATDGDGLYKLGNDIFEFFGANDGLSDQPITSVTQDRYGAYYVTSFGGSVQKIDKSGRVTELDIGLSSRHLTTSATDKQGNIWFGTRNIGLIKYDGGKTINYSVDDGLVNNLIRVLFNDSQNNLWIGTAGGLSVFDGKVFKNYNSENGLCDNIIWAISEPEPGLILVITRKGFSEITETGIKKIKLDKRLFNNRVNTALQDKAGNYWVGYSGHGITRVDKSGEQVLYYTADNGLSSDLVYNLIFDNEGNIVVGSERGIDKIFLDQNMHVLRIKNYGKVEGFDGIRTSYNSIYKDRFGYIWFGNSQGLIKFKNAEEQLNRQPPLTYISVVELNYNPVDWNLRANDVSPWYGIPLNLTLKHNENNIIFEYFGNSLTNPGEVNYQFRLLGLTNDWSPRTKRREAVYTNLPPAKYIFQVRAANSDGVWSDQPAEVQFEIVPPFWKETWFYVIVAVLLAFTIKLFNDYRIRKNLDKILTVERIRAEELAKVRKRMARDFHDNMGNQLASITVFTNLIGLKLKDKSKEINDLLENIEKHTKSLFNGTKDFIWSIDPESDDLNEVFTYVKDFGEELFENTNIDFYSSSADFKELPLPSGWSRQIVLIFKEAMTNALKHSNASEVHLDLNLNEKSFVIKLWDNGNGANLESIKKGNGFRNMNARATQIGCSIDILAVQKNKGLSVELTGQIQSEPKKSKVKLY